MTGRAEHSRDPGEQGAALGDPYGLSPAAAISVGGYFPTTSNPPVPPEVTELVRQQVAALEQTYPAWRFTRLSNPNGTPGGWEAERRAPLTHAQRAAGLLPSLARDDVPGLLVALAVQDEIAHQCGYAFGSDVHRDTA
jgi:hypothetical protein